MLLQEVLPFQVSVYIVVMEVWMDPSLNSPAAGNIPMRGEIGLSDVDRRNRPNRLTDFVWLTGHRGKFALAVANEARAGNCID